MSSFSSSFTTGSNIVRNPLIAVKNVNGKRHTIIEVYCDVGIMALRTAELPSSDLHVA
jgi:hypothetical protein